MIFAEYLICSFVQNDQPYNDFTASYLICRSSGGLMNFLAKPQNVIFLSSHCFFLSYSNPLMRLLASNVRIRHSCFYQVNVSASALLHKSAMQQVSYLTTVNSTFRFDFPANRSQHCEKWSDDAETVIMFLQCWSTLSNFLINLWGMEKSLKAEDEWMGF